MKYIKLYESFEDIDSICRNYDIENYTINSDGSIDVDGDVNLFNRDLTILPLKFGKVSGYFHCGNNLLTTLEGCPQSVGKEFYFNNNELRDLYGFPEFFDGNIYYDSNPVEEILDLFNTSRIGKVIDLLNEYDVIQQDGKVVILDRLQEVFYMLNLTIPKIKLEDYEVY